MTDTKGENMVAELAVRTYVDTKTSYGGYISDAHCREIAAVIVAAVEAARRGDNAYKGEAVVGQLAVRQYVDGTMYGRFVDDAHCKDIATVVVAAIENFRGGAEI